jgi:hypothetical protein
MPKRRMLVLKPTTKERQTAEKMTVVYDLVQVQ